MFRTAPSFLISLSKCAIHRPKVITSRLFNVAKQASPIRVGSCTLHSKTMKDYSIEHHISTPLTCKPETSNINTPKTAQETFKEAWSHMEKEYGRQNLSIPTDIVWLMGAPGAGKGVNTPLILKARKITNSPVCMSSLLTSPAMKKSIDQGKMIDDSQVLQSLFRALLDRNPNAGVLIDGFPRTEVQITCLKLFYEKLVELHNQFKYTSMANRFKMPKFSIAVLYVDEDISIARQLKRGRQIREHNEKVRKAGTGELLEERATDFDEEIVRKRYQVFMQHYHALTELGKYFPYHLVNASSTLEDVARQFKAFLDPKNIQHADPEVTIQSTFNPLKNHPSTQTKRVGVESSKQHT
ncbi:hypothetical protein K7432_007254 [Basidiobolus ranarum]|uniref:Adenylate kinase n=1 Tax=Basidiobolus ranarum TaxID=34480 RepID=A0ABR2WTS3_9FUNG